MCPALHWLLLPELWAGVFGVLLGALVPYFVEKHRRDVERTGELVAIGVEMQTTRERLRALGRPVDGRIVTAPLYRLPADFASRGVPKLIGEGLLTKPEIEALVDYMDRVVELNRGLERAGAAATLADSTDEWKRNVEKVRHILDEKLDDGRTRYERAVAAIDRVLGMRDKIAASA